MAQSVLTEFFKQAKFSNERNVDGVKNPAEQLDFYDECLQQVLKCDAESCAKIKADINNQIYSLREKCEKLAGSIDIAKSVLKEKDEEIEFLRKKMSPSYSAPVISTKIAIVPATTPVKIPATIPVTIPEETPSDSFSKEEPNEATNKTTETTAVASSQRKEAIAQTNEIKIDREKPTFTTFSHNFDNNQLAQLRSTGQLQRDDSTFVANSLKFIYDENLDSIKGKSLTGRGRHKTDKKTQLTPEKVLILKNLFGERLNYITRNEDEKKLREKSFNKHIKNAVANITRTADKLKINMEIQRKLEENLE